MITFVCIKYKFKFMNTEHQKTKKKRNESTIESHVKQRQVPVAHA